MNDTISVQTSTQSRVGDDWCQQQLLKRLKFMSAPSGEPFTSGAVEMGWHRPPVVSRSQTTFFFHMGAGKKGLVHE